MRFGIKNLGPIKDANIEIGDLTIICGKNNCGKTYLTYSIYIFLTKFCEFFTADFSKNYVEKLLKHGSCTIDLADVLQKYFSDIEKAVVRFKPFLTWALAIRKEHENTNFNFGVDFVKEDFFDILLMTKISNKWRITEACSFLSNKNKSSTIMTFELENKEEFLPPKNVLCDRFNKLVSYFLTFVIIPDAFSLTGERSGISIFADNIATTTRELEKQGKANEIVNNDDGTSVTPLAFPLPIYKEIEFFQRLKSIKQKESFFSTLGDDIYSRIMNKFTDLSGGVYDWNEQNGMQYSPKDSLLSLDLPESSSSSKSMAELCFYLKHCAKIGQVLMIDEPELNLHPANQRKMAQLLAMLVNNGVKVFITTHSDYLIREFNTLIMLKQDKPHIARIKEKEGYSEIELLDSSKVRAYVANCSPDGVSFVAASIDQESGISITTIDDVIDKMNQIQDEIIWGAE